MNLENLVLIAGGSLTGLLAGVFYAFSTAIVPGLRRLNAREHLAAMQAINDRIRNPVFMLSFLGPTVLLPLAAFLLRGEPQFPLLAAAAALHIVGANGITIAGNVPLNERLARLDLDRLTAGEADAARADFQGGGSRWMRLHTLRTWAAIAATALVLAACLSRRAG